MRDFTVVHLADLHLGKRLFGVSLLEDQAYILSQILDELAHIQPDLVVIAGDIFDTKNPCDQSVALLHDFLLRAHSISDEIAIGLIAGNHDAAVRLEFGKEFLAQDRVFIAGTWQGDLASVSLCNGKVALWLMPFVDPRRVKNQLINQGRADQAASVTTFEDAVLQVLESGRDHYDNQVINILVAHQFVTCGTLAPDRSDSEQVVSIGLVENVDARLFDDFDYVALGHIHKAQKIGSDQIRYAGTPLKYSFSEASQQKSMTVVRFAFDEVDQRLVSVPAVETIALHPQRDVRELRGPFHEIYQQAQHDSRATIDYTRVVLTDETEVSGAYDTLKGYYPLLLQLTYDNLEQQATGVDLEQYEAIEERDPLDLFADFFAQQTARDLTEQERDCVRDIFDVALVDTHEGRR